MLLQVKLLKIFTNINVISLIYFVSQNASTKAVDRTCGVAELNFDVNWQRAPTCSSTGHVMHWLHILAVALPFVLETRANTTPLGVKPDLVAKYTPKGDTWTCLDGSATIPWKAVNDDYCDCKDGSDEPGTSACPNSTFYCKNVGHLGSVIPSSRVHDGLCGAC